MGDESQITRGEWDQLFPIQHNQLLSQTVESIHEARRVFREIKEALDGQTP